MATVWRWLSRLLLALLVPIALFAAIWAYGRLTSPTPAQQAAIAVMQARSPIPAGENGFELLMALPAESTGAAPLLPICNDDTACIAAIEAAPEQASAAIVSRRAWLEAGARALQAPAFRDRRTDASVAGSLPPYQAMTQVRLLRAFDFAAGQTAAALDATCQDARGAIRRAIEPDVLIDGMLGIVMFRQLSALIVDMRRRAPQDPLPASCAALSIEPDPSMEGMLCPALQGEWHWLNRVMDDMNAQVPASAPDWALPVMHDPEWLMARSAERYAAHCGPAAAAAAGSDRVVVLDFIEPRWVDRVSRPVSVILDRIADAPYDDYAERQLDFVAQRRLVAAFLQMDAMDAALTPMQRFEALPEALRDGPRPLRFDASSGRLVVPLRGRLNGPGGGEATLPVPVPPPAA